MLPKKRQDRVCAILAVLLGRAWKFPDEALAPSWEWAFCIPSAACCSVETWIKQERELRKNHFEEAGERHRETSSWWEYLLEE